MGFCSILDLFSVLHCFPSYECFSDILVKWKRTVWQRIAVVCSHSQKYWKCILLPLVVGTGIKKTAFFHIGNDHQVKVFNRSVSLNCPCLLSFILMCCVSDVLDVESKIAVTGCTSDYESAINKNFFSLKFVKASINLKKHFWTTLAYCHLGWERFEECQRRTEKPVMWSVCLFSCYYLTYWAWVRPSKLQSYEKMKSKILTETVLGISCAEIPVRSKLCWQHLKIQADLMVFTCLMVLWLPSNQLCWNSLLKCHTGFFV